MKWAIVEGELTLTLKPEEAGTLADILKTKMAVLASRRPRYHDNLANGASEKYARLYDDAENDFDTCTYFIKLVDNLRKKQTPKNYHLYIMNCSYDLDTLFPARPERKANGQFAKGHIPATKGRKWSEWMPEDGQKAALRNLYKGRSKNNWKKATDARKVPVVGVTLEGRYFYFDSPADAGRATGIMAENIRSALKGRRNSAGQMFWFYASKYTPGQPISPRAVKSAAKKRRSRKLQSVNNSINQ